MGARDPLQRPKYILIFVTLVSGLWLGGGLEPIPAVVVQKVE